MVAETASSSRTYTLAIINSGVSEGRGPELYRDLGGIRGFTRSGHLPMHKNPQGGGLGPRAETGSILIQSIPIVGHARLLRAAEEGHIVGMPAPRSITTIEELLALPEDGLRHELASPPARPGPRI